MANDESLTYDIRLTGLVYGGDAIGRLPDGRAVFVPYGLPGEMVRVRLVDEKRGHVRARIEQVVQPSPARIEPRCTHFGVCGGCHYQHMPYPSQLDAKTTIVREQLQRIGGIVDPPVGPCVPSPAEWHYRNHVQFHPDNDGRLAYLAQDGYTRVTIQECHLPEPVLGEIWPQLVVDPDPLLTRIDLRAGSDGEVILGLESLDVQAPEMTLDMPISVIFHGKAGSIVLAGEDALTMDLMGRLFSVSSKSFFQVNTAQAENMVRHLLANLPLTPGTFLIDVYCGVGLFSAFLAGQVGRLAGIEISPEACDDYAANLDDFDNVELYQGPAELVLPALELKPDIVVLDPPRAGLDRRAIQALLDSRTAYIAYVSCDPATLARDIRRFIEGGYRLESVTPFDLFPQTYHVECIALLTKG